VEQLSTIISKLPGPMVAIGTGALMLAIVWKALGERLREMSPWRTFTDREELRLALMRQWYDVQRIRKDIGLEPSDDHGLDRLIFHGKSPLSTDGLTQAEHEAHGERPVLLGRALMSGAIVTLTMLAATMVVMPVFARSSVGIGDRVALVLLAATVLDLIVYVLVSVVVVFTRWRQNQRERLFVLRWASGWTLPFMMFAFVIAASIAHPRTGPGAQTIARPAATPPP